MHKFIIIFIVFPLLFILSCTKSDPVIIEEFNSAALRMQKELAPDLSLEVFNFKLSRENNQWNLTGDYTVKDADRAITQVADSLLGKNNYETSLLKLPVPELGDSTIAIVKISTAPLRRSPKHSAEMVDQVIMGSKLKLLKRKGMWYLCKTEYGYLGWIARYSFQTTDLDGLKQWEQKEHARVTALTGFIYSKPSDQSIPVSDVTLNAVLAVKSRKSDWVEVELPDEKTGYIARKLVDFNSPDPDKLNADKIINIAESMMGIPYLWGGNSTKGCDCSGFTQTVFKTQGKLLPRDARQQVFLGEEINYEPDFSNVMAGDLLFFGKDDRITHVGISLGGYNFIHQDSQVNIDSFDENAENFNAFRKRSLKKIKRIIF